MTRSDHLAGIALPLALGALIGLWLGWRALKIPRDVLTRTLRPDHQTASGDGPPPYPEVATPKEGAK